MLSHRSDARNSVRWILPVAVLAVACFIVLAGTWSSSGVEAQPVQTPTATIPPLIRPTVVIPIQLPTPTPPVLGVPTNTSVPEPTEVPPTEPPVAETVEPQTPEPTEADQESPAPTTAPGVTPAPVPPPSRVTVTVRLHKCPDVLRGDTLEALAKQCTLDIGPTAVNVFPTYLDPFVGDYPVSPGGEGSANTLTFPNLPIQQLRVGIRNGWGYEQTALFCRPEAKGASTATQAVRTIHSSPWSFYRLDPVAQDKHLICDSYGAKSPTGSLTIHSWKCPVGYDPTAGDDEPEVACTVPLAGMSYRVWQQSVTEVVTDATGSAIINNIPAGLQFPIDQMSDPQWNAVFLSRCQIWNADGSIASDTGFINDFGFSYWPLVLPAGGTGTCDFFNVPNGPTDTGNLYLRVYACPAGFDPAEITSHSSSETDACENEYYGAILTLDPAAAGASTMTAISGVDVSTPGFARFLNIPHGNYTLTIDQSPDIASAFRTQCEYQNYQAPRALMYAERPVVEQFTFPMAMPSSETFCDLYVVLSDGSAELPSSGQQSYLSQPLPTPTPTIAVINQPLQPLPTPVPTIRPVITPVPTQQPRASVVPVADCFSYSISLEIQGTEQTPEIGNIRGDDPPFAATNWVEGQTLASGSFDLIWPDLEVTLPISWVVERPGGCLETPEPSVETETEEPTEEVADPPTEEALEIPGIRELTLVKLACPQQLPFDPESTNIDDFINNCGEDPGDTTFTITDPDGAELNNRTIPGLTDALFTHLPTGQLTITETPVYGFGEVAPFCGIQPNGPWSRIPVYESATGHAWDFLPEDDTSTLRCVIFNLRAEPTDLVIYKWQCPSGFDINSLYSDPKEDCTTLMPGVTFKLEDANGIPVGIEATTDAGGVAVFDDIPSGAFRVAEVMPPGIASAFLFDCGQTDPDGNVSTLPPPNPLQLSFVAEFNIPANSPTACNWYNIPEPNGTVVVHKWECPVGYEPDPAVSDPRNDCTVALDGVTFSLYTSTSPVRTRVTGDDGSGTAIFTGVDQSTFVLHEQVPPQIEETFYYYCERQYADGSVATYYDGDYVSMGDGLVSDLQLGETFTCNWFNTPVDPGTNTIQVYAHFCQDGPPANVDFATYDLQCTGLLLGMDFTFLYPNNSGGAVMGDDGQGNYHFSWDVPNETFGIRQESSPYLHDPVVFCYSQDVTTGVSGPFGAQGDTVTHSFSTASGNSLACHWFYIQLERRWLSVHKWVCPPGTLPDQSNFYYQSVCQESTQPFDFSMTNPDGTFTGQTDPGWVGWDDISPGDFTIQETIPPGFLEPEIFCDLTINGASQGVTDGYTNGVVTGTIPDGVEGRFLCRWYNIPIDPETINTAHVVKLLCPPGMPAGLTAVEYEVNCTVKSGGFDFSLNGNAPDTDDGSGGYTWFDVGGGDITIAEELLPGFLEPEVFCDLTDLEVGTSQQFEPDATNGSIGATFPDEAGNRLICVYYNLPEDNGDNTIMITKYECPPGTESDPAFGLGHFLNACQISVDPFTFTTTDANGLSSNPPNNGGLYEVTGVPAGPFSIQEDIPSEFGTPVVYCSLVDANNVVQSEHVFASATGYVDGEFPANAKNYRYGCDWMNIPGGPGDVTIHKWTCPPGYDLNAPGANPLLDCTEATNGVRFQIDGPSGQQTDATGDVENGAISFVDLDPGNYTITELVPPGTEQVFVLDCVGLSDGSVHPVPLSTGGTLTIAVTADDSIVCNWFNVPEDDGSGDDLTVIKYWCDTETFVSTAECEVYESGVIIDLLAWNGSDWVVNDTQVTDSSGTTTWTNLTPGEYWLDEHDLQWCAIQTTSFNADKDAFVVQAGQDTVVRLYNCGADPDDDDDDLPTKYPNTGVDPAGTGSQPAAPSRLPLITGLLGLAMLWAIRRIVTARR